ncbi:hypothetical protein JVX92_07570 [Microbacterium hominis]|uniref:hypothetical protein n=1 Tax=Microbacterium hominis TaxID=162426 RepID=UPI001963C77D|nr:hypothetical protein [Microbacterium hominis]QRY39423.1 hypothetical protein JVX92_07570 [Microbacterium hominis]
MFAHLDAVVPIAGSVYAGGSFLVEQARVRWEYRTRKRVQALVNERRPAAQARARARTGNMMELGSEEIADFNRVMLAASGLEPATKTIGEFDLDQAMSGTAAAPGEIRRQAVLLLSAVIGVLLIALEPT